MRLHSNPVDAEFVSRLSRFSVEVVVGGRREVAYLPNSGRLRELLRPEVPLVLVATPRAPKTRYRVVLAKPGPWVSLDAHHTIDLVLETLAEDFLPLTGYVLKTREPQVPEGRLDLLLEGPGPDVYLEAKSVTLVEGGVARFPDAPTERGRKHLGSLQREVAQGNRAMVVFVIQRPDARCFEPNTETDPAFASRLWEAAAGGVEVHALGCHVDRLNCRVNSRVPVEGASLG